MSRRDLPAHAAARTLGTSPFPAENRMRSALLVSSLVATAVALPAQAIARTAISAGLTVQITSQTQTLPAGAALFDGQSIAVSANGESASTVIGMPPGSATFRMVSVAQGSLLCTFSGSAIATLSCPSPTAVDLRLSANVGVPMCGASVDVGNDGTAELSVYLLAGTTTVGATFGPGPLQIRTSSYGYSLKGSASATVEFQVVRRLTATATAYLTGCGPTLALAPTSTGNLRATVGGMPPAGLAFVVLGLGTANVTLPFGGCPLGVTTDLPLPVALDAGGNGRLDIGVPLAVTAVAANVQAVGLDFVSQPNRVATSDALSVQVTR
jgi:hypothetical protein